MRKTQKDKRFTSTQKWKMAWEWGTREYLCLPYVTFLWCPSWKLPKDRGKKWNSYFWPRKSYLDFETLVSIFLNRTTLNDSKFMYLPFGKSIHLEEFNMLILLLNSLYSRKKLSRDLGSPGSRQLLQLQLSSPNFLNFGPPSWFSVVFNRLDPWVFGHALILNDFEE